MFTIYLHTKFQLPIFSGSLVIVNKTKAKCRFHATAMLLLYSKCKLYRTLNGVSVASTSHVHATVMLLLLIVGLHKVKRWGGPNCRIGQTLKRGHMLISPA